MGVDDKDYQQVVASAADALDLFVPGIKAAIRELEEKHGPLTPNLLRAFAIFQREGGEVADAVLDLSKMAAAHQAKIIVIPGEVLESATQHLGHEIAQCIAVLTYMLINLFGDRIESSQESGAPIVLVPENDKVN